MPTMNARNRLATAGIATAALALVLTGCGGTTVEGDAPEVASEPPATSTASADESFAQEHAERPTTPISPPPPEPEPEPAPVRDPAEPPPPEPEGDQAPEDADVPEPGGPEPLPGTGDFVALLDRQGLALPEGVDPVATATEACGRFDDGQQMIEVSGWLGDHGQLEQEQQGYFLGAAVGTYCPENFPKLG